ncbi:PREDICTED: uncharacterized protein LOC104800189 isoform X2 [Tarenaya hassleriana]|uniref:uncharacterized protein LOC104800189 isoform X2 n=1 Tax=Tarenaya hassleriana TaxID=28532 RepID=UPI00053C8EBD|nr:PREDICTED: uncharacterized protein LOC104800189 isoform X2 [Tarenaya hassleriana]
MGESDERDGPVSVIGVEPAERRNVRRRLVQSALFPHKSPAEVEPSSDRRSGDGNEEGDADGEEEEFCGSQGKRTRKQRAKATPKNGTPKKLAKEKSPRKSTPKKNASKNGSIAANQTVAQKVSPPVTNLRLEAKLRAEARDLIEDSRMSAGKQIHPFFSLWKAGKRNKEAAEAESDSCRGKRRDKISTIGPIHVYERFQDGYLSIDWKNWTFCEETSTSGTYDRRRSFSSLFEQSSKEFGIKELPSGSHPDRSVIEVEEHDQFVTQSEDTSEATPGLLTTQEEKSRYLRSPDGADEECEVDEVVFLSSHADGAAEFGNAHQSRSFQESGQPHNSLWIDKYQPRSAMEVCGNTESVKVMNDWLCLWHEKGFQTMKEPGDGNERKMQDADYSCYGSDSDAENIDDEGCLKNVLLVIGPVGSGKSAAIHACAKEQGFKILESNASECQRMKMGNDRSYGLTRSLEPPLNFSNEQSLTPTFAVADGSATEELIEVTTISDKESQSHSDTANLKPLILFEDVDICFPDDRGLVSAIQQIAEKAKGPVILTTNDMNHGLPDNLERLEICFATPSTEELLRHLSSVCAAEGVNVCPGLIEQLARSSHGDIRKAIMHLQFWFQSKRYRRARKLKNTCSPVLFDLDAGHMLLPRIIPWDFCSQLSQFVENEIVKSLSMAEENSTSVEVSVEEVENDEMLNKLWRCDPEKEKIEAKKAAMLRRNSSYEDCDELQDNIPCELSRGSRRSMSVSRLNKGRMRNVVLSSDSEDEPLNDKRILTSSRQKEKGMVLEDMQKDTILLANTSIPSMGEMLEASCYLSEMSKFSCANDLSQSVDISLVPESSFVPETEIDNGAALSPRAISCGHFDGGMEVSMSEDFSQKQPPSFDRGMDRFHLVSNCIRHESEVIAESSHGMEVEECVEEHAVNSLRQYQVSDECSRIDFGRITKAVQKLKVDALKDSVQEAWRKLRSNHANLKPYLDSEPIDAPQVLDLTYQISNLLSEAELSCSRCQEFGYLEPEKSGSGDADSFSFSDEFNQMAFNVAQQRFHFYAKEIAATVSDPSSMTTAELNLESLALTTDMVLGRGSNEDEASRGYACLEMKPRSSEGFKKSERRSCLMGAMKSIVPPRSYLALKGDAFHEYLSFLGRISRSETSNLSEAIRQTRRRRSRPPRHYLSTGSMMLSPEDIALLDQHSSYRETPPL